MLPWQTETLPTFANPASPCGSAVTNSGTPAAAPPSARASRCAST
jgi:hypothetical protein